VGHWVKIQQSAISSVFLLMSNSKEVRGCGEYGLLAYPAPSLPVRDAAYRSATVAIHLSPFLISFLIQHPENGIDNISRIYDYDATIIEVSVNCGTVLY
jgi:hypothetical protein